MNIAVKMTSAFFDAKGIKYGVSDDGKTIRSGMRMDNKDAIQVIFAFDDNATTVAIRSFDFCKVPEAKIDAIYQLCSKLNARFRWVKFYLDEDNTVTLAEDAVIQADTCGEEVFELFLRLVSIADEAYPEFMKTLWT